MTKERYFFTVLILGALTALGPFSIDMYLPGFTAIAKSFHTTTAIMVCSAVIALVILFIGSKKIVNKVAASTSGATAAH